MSDGAILYEEPNVVTILTQTSFILALNVINHALDKTISCGLVGQILIGMAWGTPGADILGLPFQQTTTDLGYLGLILIVFEGGLSTNMKALRSNLLLSLFVALTGITLPIGLSFLLIKMCGATVLQAFAAGCALSSTSLGTTFTILSSSGLKDSRLGVVLTSAAMLDDVVGLVLVQVISNLGASAGKDFSAATIIRPVFVSLGYAALIPALLYLLNKLGPRLRIPSWTASRVGGVLISDQAKIVLYTTLLVGAVASASYAGTSVLFAAYLAGLLVSSGEEYASEWHDGTDEQDLELLKKQRTEAKTSQRRNSPKDISDSEGIARPKPEITQPQDFVSNPAHPSSTLDIPLSQNSTDPSHPPPTDTPSPRSTLMTKPKPPTTIYETYYGPTVTRLLKPFFFASIGLSIPITRLFTPPTLWRALVYSLLMILGKLACGAWLIRSPRSPPSFPSSRSTPNTNSHTLPARSTPHSTQRTTAHPLYPPLLIGTAMVSRGEIGFLISAIAQANGLFDSTEEGKGDLFLVVTWAVLICTVVGPVGVGILVRRVAGMGRAGGGEPLGVWGGL